MFDPSSPPPSVNNVVTPREIRDMIMDITLDFQKKMVEYLETFCIGQFLTGAKSEVFESVENQSQDVNYHDSTTILLTPPPPPCDDSCKDCVCKGQRKSWWKEFNDTVDDILLRSNQHIYTVDKDGNDMSYCTNSRGECKRRFLRDTSKQMLMDLKTDALNLKKGEAWMNSVTAGLTYLLRCNSDVTSLLSEMAIKAVMTYVSNYMMKPSLKTYSVFEVVKIILDKNSEMIASDLNCREKMRKIFTQVVNSLMVKLEIDGPMVCLYMLRNPNYYTSHIFVPFY